MAGKRLEEKADKSRDLSFWLLTLAWGMGVYIYIWLLVGVLKKRVYWDEDYWKESYEICGFCNFWFPLICGGVPFAISFLLARSKKSAEGKSRQLFRIVVAVLPALFLVSSFAVLALTLATYNGDWRDARQGIATAFAALIAAVGVVVSVAVSYKTGEENRLAQQNILEKQLQSQQTHLETQLEHQRVLEEEKGRREQQKLDAELIKNLNDRLHEIIPRRYGDNAEAVSASYFQLATLYKDWETLSATSPLIALQKESQQRNILKLLFGVYQVSDEKNTSDEKNFSERSEVDIRTLNSVIQDIFPLFGEGVDNESSSAQKEEAESKTPDGKQSTFDLSYLDLRGLDLSRRDLRGANLIGANLGRADLEGAGLSGANLRGARLEEADLEGAHLERAILRGARLEGADLIDAYLKGAKLGGARMKKAILMGARLEEAILRGARLEGADLIDAHLKGADLGLAHLKGANLQGADLEEAKLGGTRLVEANLGFARLDKASFFFGWGENPQDPKARIRIINQLKASAILPAEAQLLKAQGFDQALVNEIIQAHKEEQAGKEAQAGKEE